MIANWRQGERAFGGSTITQQTSKNLFLDNRKSYVRKLQEIFISWRLERHFSKNDILELYLNVAEFGPDIFGVQAASHYYFDKQPSQINAAEGAYLALLLPSPRRYHYTLYQNRNLTTDLKRKYTRILRDMRQSEFISMELYQRYLRQIEQPGWPSHR